MSDQGGGNSPAKSMVGPLEELYLVSFLVDGPEQAKMEKALRAWTDKWLFLLQHDEVIDKAAMDAMTPTEQQKFNNNMVTNAKQKMGEVMALNCGIYREGPLNDLKSVQTGNATTTNYRQYSMMAVKRWEK